MIAAIAAFLGLQGGTVKWIIAGLVALFIVSAVSGGYIYVSGIQSDLVQAREDLAAEKVIRELAEKSAEQLRQDIEKQAAAMKFLNIQISQTRDDWAAQLDEINKVDTTDAHQAAADLTRLSRDLNRMLERASHAGY